MKAKPEITTFGPEHFLNRELSWLEFNQRVLDQATGDDHPLLERVKFLAIVCSNLDEFFMVRVAALLRKYRKGVEQYSIDGMTVDFYPFEMKFIGNVATRTINEVKGVNRVVYDMTSKPPGTIEWE